MGKSSKKSIPKVDASPAVLPSTKSGKKGKRETEDELPKQVSAKKQKRNESAEQIAEKKKIVVKKQNVKEGSDDSSSESEKPVAKSVVSRKKQPASVPPPKENPASDSDSSSDDESDDDNDKTKLTKNVPSVGAKKKAESSETSDSDDCSDDDSEEDVKAPAPAKTSAPASKNTPMATKKISESSDDDSSDDESGSDDEPKNAKVSNGTKKIAKKESSESSEEDDDSDDEQASKVKDVEMADVVSPQAKSDKKASKTPATPKVESSSGNTLFVGNLSYSVSEEDVKNFFKDAGEIVEVRFAAGDDGRFRGFGHVEFANAEAAKEALALNGKDLLSRRVKLDMAAEKGARTPHSASNNGNSFPKGQSHTVFVRGFDTSLGVEEVKSGLQEAFSSCGEISRIFVPTNFESGEVKGFAYLDFNDADSFNQALELNGSDLGGHSIHVDEAKPRDSQPGGGRGGFGRSGGGGGFGRSGGRGSGGRGSGGRFSGGRGDRGGRRGRRGRGSPW